MMAGKLLVDFPDRSHGRSSGPSVTFEEHIEITFVESLIQEHKSDLWYSCRQMKSFKCHSALLLRKIQSMGTSLADFAQSNLDDTSSWMGLEAYLTEKSASSVERRRERIVAAVVREHRRQVRAGIHDPDALARVSAAESEASHQRARIIALLHDERKGRTFN